MEFLAALNLALGVIETIKKAAPVVESVVKDFQPIGEALIQKWTGKDLTDDQREQLRNQIIRNHERFQRPIPPENEQ